MSEFTTPRGPQSASGRQARRQPRDLHGSGPHRRGRAEGAVFCRAGERARPRIPVQDSRALSRFDAKGERRPRKVRPRRESRQHNGFTLRCLSQLTFATKSAPLRHAGDRLACLITGEDRKWRVPAQNDAFDPSCVKTGKFKAGRE